MNYDSDCIQPEEDKAIWRHECDSYLDLLISASNQPPKSKEDIEKEENKKYFCIIQGDDRAQKENEQWREYQLFHYEIMRKDIEKKKKAQETFMNQSPLVKEEPKTDNIKSYNSMGSKKTGQLKTKGNSPIMGPAPAK